MASPGRRREPSILTPSFCRIFLFLTLLCSSPVFAASAVLGIDFGTGFIKATLVKPGIPLEIVITKDSKRKETAAIAFKPSTFETEDPQDYPERLYGADAMALAARFPDEVYPNLKPLLSTFEGTTSALYGIKYPSVHLEKTSGGSIGLRSGNFKVEEPVFSIEELIAMEFKNILYNAQVMAGKSHTIRNAVLTVPPYYTADERNALVLAANLAGLEVMSLISDGLAVGLNYAMPRTFPNINQGEKPEYHLVYDMGAGSTTATILKFQAKVVKDIGRFNKTIQEASVVGTGWNRALGGDLLNIYIINDMITKFVESFAAKKQGVQAEAVRKHGRTMAKLSREAERLRLVLSANTLASTSFEELYAEVDFKYKVSRNEFEALLANDTNANIREPIHTALERAELTIDQIDSVVLHGGLVRTPFIQRELESLVGDAAKLKSNVNADEAAAFGAGFKAASLSPSFRVKEIRDSDATGYGITLEWSYFDKQRHQKLFQPTSQTGVVKHMTFKNLDDFTLTFKQEVPSLTGDVVDQPIAQTDFTNLTESVLELTEKHGCKRSNITNTVSIRLDPASGLPGIVKAFVSCEGEPDKKGSIVDGVKGLFGFGGKKDGEDLEAEEVLAEQASTSSSETSSSVDARATGKKTSKKEEKKAEVPKPRLHVINVNYETKRLGRSLPNEAQLQQILDRLEAFDRADASRVERSETFNSLEAFTYRARDMLREQSFIESSTSTERSMLESALQATSEWLSSDGSRAALKMVKEKLNDLTALVTPVVNRRDEASKRPKQIETFLETVNRTETLISSIRQQIEKAALEASEALKSASTSSASTTESSTVAVSSSDGEEDLEADPYASFTTSETATPTPSIFTSAYTEADLTSIVSTYDTIFAWFKEKQAAQDKLSTSEDPVLLFADLVAKTKQLNDAWTALMAKRFKLPPKFKPSSSSKTTKTKTKSGAKASKSTTTDSATESSAEAEPTPAPPEEAPVPVEEQAEGNASAAAPEPEQSPDIQHPEL